MPDPTKKSSKDECNPFQKCGRLLGGGGNKTNKTKVSPKSAPKDPEVVQPKYEEKVAYKVMEAPSLDKTGPQETKVVSEGEHMSKTDRDKKFATFRR